VSSGIVRRSEAAAVRAGIIAEQMKRARVKDNGCLATIPDNQFFIKTLAFEGAKPEGHVPLFPVLLYNVQEFQPQEKPILMVKTSVVWFYKQWMANDNMLILIK
jgi:hypothetical protein